MKTANPIEHIRRSWHLMLGSWGLAVVALMLSLLPVAALPTMKQTFFVPLPEADLQASLKAIDTTGTAVGATIKGTISIVVPTAGTIIVYDQWEDGYEADTSNPVQASTQIWGDGNPAHGQPPGYPSNILPAGAVIKLQNSVGLPRSPSSVVYDGRDRICSTAAVAVTRAAWATVPGTVLASATEVYDTRKYGTVFKIPVGTNTGSTQLFEYSGLHIIASQDLTTVTVTADPSLPLVTVTKTMNLGDSMFVNGGVKAGAIVSATKPVQVHEITGDIGSTYEGRTFAIRPTSLWGASYFAPVGTTLSTETHNIFLYNPNVAAINVTYETVSSTGTVSVPANGNYQFTMPMNSGGHFYTAGAETFYAVGANDSGGAASANQVHDWGYALLPDAYLTTGIIVPWGPGSDTTGANGTKPDGNGSPVWVTPTANTTVYVNYTGDLTVGANTASNGAKYTDAITVSKWQSQRIYDTTDNDMTGARIFTTDGTRLACAWGEDPSKAGAGSPYLDLGTTIVPFPQPSVLKSAALVVDVNSNGQIDAGDTLEYTVRVSNEGVVDLDNTIVLDNLPSSLIYVVGSTKVNGVTVTDNVAPATPFPVDEGGYTLASIPPGSFSTVVYRTTVAVGSGTIPNVAITSTGGQSLTSTTTSTVTAGVVAPVVNFTDVAGTTVATYAANGSLYLKLTDAAANTSATTLQTVTVLVKDTNTGDLQTVTLTETGINTGIFTNLTALPSSTTSGALSQDGTLYALAGDALTVSYTNSVSGLSASAAAAISGAATPVKKLYLNNPSQGPVTGQGLDRINPAGGTTVTTSALAAPTTSTISVGGATTKATSDTVTGGLGTAGAATSLTFSHTAGAGSNRLLLVAVATGSPNNTATQGTVSGVTFNGVAMTLVGSALDAAGTNANTYIYQLKDASINISTAANVVVTATSSTIVASATTFIGVNQTTPLGTYASATSTSGATLSLASAYASATGELVYSIGAIEQGNTNRTIATAVGQTELANTGNNQFVDFAVSTIPGAATVSPTYTASIARAWTMGVVAIKPAAGTAGGTTTFSQTPAMAKAFTMPAGGSLSLTTYVSGITGSMPATPLITATLKKGATYAGATTFATLTSPAYSSGAATLTWTGTLATATTVAAGEFVYMDISNGQSGAGFAIDYSSTTKPSAISLPASTVITVDSFGIYDAAYPGGSLVSSVNNGQKAYMRVVASDPFGSYDVTSLDVTLTDPSAGTSTVNLTSTVASTATSKTFEYVWTSGPSTGGYSITAKAKEGSEGLVFATATTPLQVAQLDLGTPSITTFTDASGNPVTSYTTSGPVYAQVIDGDKNTNPLTVQTITAVITTSTGDRETITLTETGVNTGIFRSGAITVNTGTVTQGNGVLNIAAGSSLLVSYVDAVDSTDTSSANAVIATASTTSVSIYKSLVSPASGHALVGGSVVYNIQVANTGSNSLATVSLADTFDNAKLAYVSATTAPSSTGTGTLSWTNVGPLTAGQVVNIQVSFTALAPGSASNSASAGGTASAGPSAASVTIDNPQVAVTKTLLTPASGPAYKGDNVTFRILVQNTGNTVITTLPVGDSYSGRSFQYVSATNPPDASGSGALLWNNIGPLAAGASWTTDVTMLVIGAAAPAANTADVSYAVDASGNSIAPVTSTASVTTLAGSIGSTIFQDKNNNGVADAGEGIANVTVFADLNNNGVRDAGEPFAITDASGTYLLYNLARSTFTVVVDTSTLPAYLNKQTVDPDATKDNKTSITLTTLAMDNTTANFGYQYPAVSGTVYDDANGLLGSPLNTVDGSGTNAGGLLYANLINASNTVLQAVAVASNGTYTLPNVTPNSYTVVLSTTQGSAGASAPAAALPTGWVNTGEFLGSGAGSDGSVNGILAVAVAGSDVSNANFGIDRRPTAVAASSSSANPGSTTQVTVPTLSGTDPEGSTVTTLIIKTLPTNGTLYYNSIAVTVGQTISSYNPTLLTLDPTETGAATAIFTYSVVDPAGAESSAVASVTMTFTAPSLNISIGGNVYDDANGLSDSTVNGSGTNAGGLLYANLINGSNLVTEVVKVATDGSYSFGSVVSSVSTSSYTIVLSTTQGTVGSAAPAAALPGGWANTGEFLGTGAGNDGTANGILAAFSVSNASVSTANFGIDRLPTATAVSAASQPNLANLLTVVVPALSGTDPEDGATTTVVINTLPASGVLYYGATPVAVTAGQSILSFNPALLTVDPTNAGSPTVSFTYSVKDAAGQSSAAVSVTMPFTGISVSGNVYDDANGLLGTPVNTVDGSGTNGGGVTLYAYLYLTAGTTVSQVATVATNGTYLFPATVAAGSYTVRLSTTSVAIGGTVPTASLPTGWVNTGEFVGTGTGSDATVDGNVAVTVAAASVANVNFGIDRSPTALAVTAAAQLNPGSTTRVAIPALSGTDPEDTSTSTVVIKTLATNGTLYYNGTVVTLGQIIPSFNGTLLTLDPIDGATTASFTYAVQDLAGKESAAVAVSLPITDITVAGSVYDDANGQINNTVDGTGTNAGGLLYANLVNGSSQVLQSALVAADGTYSFTKVAPNASYSVTLSINQGLTGGVAPVVALPSGYVNTGEHIGAGTGSDGTADGIIAVAVTTTSVSNVNFGIDQLPAAAAVSAASQANPAGTNRVQVATLSGTDPEDASVTTIIIKTLATNGTLYYNGTAVTVGQVLTSYSASLLTVDPIDGSPTVSFTYSVVDAAGKESAAATVSLPFAAVGIAGSVFDDADGSKVQNGLEAGTYAGGGLYVNVLDSTGTTVVASAAVASNGLYSIAMVVPNTTYVLQLSNVQGTPSSAAPTQSLPVGWVTTGENANGTPDGNPNGKLQVAVTTSTASGQNFGIEQVPHTTTLTPAAQGNPGGTTQVTVPTLAGTDPEDGALGSGSSFQITNLAINGTLYYSGTAVTLNQIISNYNPALLTVDPADGAVTVDFNYAAVDAAGKADPNPASVSMPFTTLSISGTVWDDADGSANNTFAGIFTSGESSTDAGGIHANLIGSNGFVIASSAVNSNGTYAFSGLTGGQSGLTINLTPVPATVGSTSTASLPSAWVATSPLTQNAFNLVATSITAKDFGIDQLPTAQGVDVPGQPNPESGNVTLPSANFIGTDPEGPVKFYIITAMPTHANSVTISGTTYTSGNFPVGGVSIAANTNGTLPTGAVAVYPTTGAVTVNLSFKVRDAAGKDSSVGSLLVPFGVTTVGGTVWDDADNSANATFSSIRTGTESGANASGLYAILVGSNGKVLASQLVASDGTYLFQDVGTPSGVSVWLATSSTAVGQDPPAVGVPGGWTATSPLAQTAFNVTASVGAKDYGIEQLPDSESAMAASQANPGGTTSVTLSPTLFHGTDVDGTVANLRIMALPTNATSITINGTTYGTGYTAFPVGGVTVTTNSSGYPTQTISVDPGAGALSVAISYAAIDNAGKQDPTPGTVTVPFTYITLSGSVFDDANGLTDVTVNGTGTNISAALHVNLIDSNNIVLATTSVNTDGTYTFTNAPPNILGEVMLSTNAGVVGQSEPGYSLPANWVNTGESAGGTLDGNPDGELKFTIVTSDVSALNFGIEQLPDTTDLRPAAQANPGGTVQVTVPTLAGTDPEDGALGNGKSFKITSLPGSGTLYYGGTPVTLNQVISGYVPANLTVDPNSGTVTVSFSYAAVDAATNVDLSSATVAMPFTDITLSGTVFDDVNGSKVQDGLEAGTNAGGLSVNLLNAAATSVVATTTVASNGSYSFANVLPNTNYILQLTVNPGTVGNAPPATAVPSGWVTTGENAGGSPDATADGSLSVAVGTGAVAAQNFGIEQLPDSGTATATSQANPGGTTSVAVSASLFSGSDTDGTVASLRITGFPSHTTSITINGSTYSAANFPSGGVTVPTNGLGQPTQAISVDPADGAVSVVLTYAVIDNAGKEAPSPGSVTLPFTVSIAGKVFDDADGSGVQNGSEAGTYAGGGGLYVNLLNAAGTTVVASAVVAGDGSYVLPVVPPNATYILQLSINAGTPGSGTPVQALPSGWVTTGENAGGTPDGNPNGKLQVAVVLANASGQNFGIEQLPETTGLTAAAQANPGDSIKVVVPTLAGSDPEDGVLGAGNSFQITALGVNGTLYYNDVAVTINQIISNYDPTKLKVDPNDGAVSVMFDYAAVDAAGKADPTPATVTLPFSTLTISGTVWDDADGSALVVDGVFTGIQTGSEAGTDAGGIHANLIGFDGKVIATTPVNPDGTYSFSGLNGGQSGLTINLTPVPATVGDAAPSASLPTGWVATSPLAQAAFALVGTSISAKDFGIEQLPTAQGVDVPGQSNPGGLLFATVPSANFLGTDPEGPVKTYVISRMPTNATSIKIINTEGTATYTSIPTEGVSIGANPDGTLPSGAISIDPAPNSVTVEIFFKVSDAAGKLSGEEFLYMPFGIVTVGGTVWDDANNSAGGTFSDIQNGHESGANAPGLYAILVDSLGKVLASQLVAADGTYLFQDVGTPSGVSVLLATSTVDVGLTPPAAGVPSGWAATSPLAQIAFDVTASVGAKDFGIEQLPDSESATAASQANPGGTTSVTVSSSLFHGTDADGTVASLRIMALPDNATSITINGTLYTIDTFPGIGVTVPTNSSGYPTQTISVDPIDGAVSVAISYAAIDNAGMQDTSSGTVTVPFTYISLSGTVFDDADGTQIKAESEAVYAGGDLHVNLVDTTNHVIATSVVAAGGTYSFTNVAPNTAYELQLTTNAGIVGQLEPEIALPSNWVTAGENVSGTSDGAPDGGIFISVGTSNAATYNFGIEQLPSTTDLRPASQSNPRGTAQVTVPTLAGSDPEDTTVTCFQITSLPASGTLYYNTAAVTLNQVILDYDSTKLTVDPNDGAVTVSFSYAAVDVAGKADSTPATVVMPFTDISLTGTVFDDADGSKVQNGIEPGTNAGGGLYVNLLNAAGTSVVATTTVNSDGTYSVASVAPNASYILQLTIHQGTVGPTVPATELPANWVNTGENVGGTPDATVDGKLSVAVAEISVAAQNFAIEQLPDSAPASQTYMNPGGTATVTVPTLSGSDPEDGDLGFGNPVVVTLPSNGTLYYDGVEVEVGQTIIHYDPAKLKLDPHFEGSGVVAFAFSFKDAAGQVDPSPATVTMTFTGVSLGGTVLHDTNGLNDSTVNGSGTNLGGLLHANLLNAGGTVLASVAVATDGTYYFPSISSGGVTVQISVNAGSVGDPAPATALPDGWINTGEHLGTGTGSDGAPDGLLAVTVVTADVADANFGIQQLGTISGTVRADINGDGSPDTLLSGVTLTLKYSNGSTVTTALTDSNGAYSFTDVALGSYQVVQTQPAGYDFLSDADGGDPSIIGNVTPLTVTEGSVLSGNDFLDVSCPDTWAQWKAQHPGQTAGGNPDADAYDNLAEFAFALPTYSGAGNAWWIQPSALDSTVLDGVFVRPIQAVDNVTYSLQYAAAPGNPTVWTSTALTALASGVITIGAGPNDCTETVTIHNLQSVTGHATSGIVRLKAYLVDGATTHTSYTETEGWTRTTLQSCSTYNNPYLRETAFTGTVTAVSGQVVSFGSTVGLTFAPSGSYYMEVTSGTSEGHRFDVVSATGSTVTLAAGGSPYGGTGPFNTLAAVPGDLAGASVVIRSHMTLGRILPVAGFQAAADMASADQVQTFANGAWTTYWLQSGSPAMWVAYPDNTADAGTTVMPPGEGMFVSMQGAANTLLAYGEVRQNAFTRPLGAAMNLVGGGYPLDQSPNRVAATDVTGGRQMTTGAGFFGSRDFKTADSFYLWQGDTTAGVSSYTTYYLLYSTSPAVLRWVKVGDAKLTSVDAATLLSGNRSAFIRVAAARSAYTTPRPWTP